MGFIYLIRNKVNGKLYVGKTTGTIEARWRGHTRKKAKGCRYLHAAINKYGVGAFTVRQLSRVPDEMLSAVERFWIALLGTTKSGYNLREGGEGGRHSPETRQLMSQARQQSQFSTSEWMDSIRALRTFKPLTEEHKEKLRRAGIGNKNALKGRA